MVRKISSKLMVSTAGRSGAAGRQTSIKNALTLLGVFAEVDGPVDLDALCAKTGMSETALLELISPLLDFHYLQQLEDNRYEIGFAVLSLAAGYRHSSQPAEIVLTTLRRLVEITSESATFFIADGDDRVCVHRVDPARAIRDYIRIGTRLPLKYGAGGHVILAFNNASGEIYDEVRRHYVAFSIGELEPDEASLAVPVFASHSRFFGAIVLSGPRTRFTPAMIGETKPILMQHAAELTVKLGGDAGGLKKKLAKRHTGANAAKDDAFRHHH